MNRHTRALAFTATSALLIAAAEGGAPARAADIASGSIIFTQTVPGTAVGLVITNPDGSGTHLLHPSGNGLSATSQIFEPAVSPDGSRVAFGDVASRAVWVAGVDGSRPVRISSPTGSAVDSEPTWSPDGTSVFFTRRAGTAQIMKASADGDHDEAAVFFPTGTNDTEPSVAVNGDLAFERNVNGTSTIFVLAAGAGSATPFANGARPAWSPDGSRLAYDRGSALLVKTRAGQESLIGTSGVQASRPAWAADGAHIAFEGSVPGHHRQIWVVDTSTLTVSPVGAEPPDGVVENAPAWQTIRKTTVDRVGGADRIDTAVAASHLGYDTPNANGTGTNGGRVANAVVLSRSDTFADALAGSALAGSLNGPLLLTPTASLDARTAAEITRCLRPGGTVFLLGDSGALSSKVQAQVLALGFQVRRLAGPDRYATAAAIAAAITPNPVTILVATGANFPDALAAGAGAAGVPGTVVVLSADRVLPGSTAAYLAAHAGPTTRLIGVGDQGVAALRTAFPAGRVQSAAGADRFATAAAVAQTFFTGVKAPRVVGLATGFNWPDALAGGALLGANNGPLLLADKTGIPASEADYLRTEAGAISEVIVNGDTGVVSGNAAASVANVVGVFGQANFFDNRRAPVLP
ncbi:Periplasmic component of the Tol biopolymer transport system-like protein [Catenulispora acidiphila DSM 44928]|uniref:Periplasmic component of the Tol biopolymer transport system-like protein n=1 Tax=Catenulispora acidiphila (strain DSM 44928 / JCM 14897 / NBRC 102108 / NRRL B-24433 / ID139908) TaxID=479433 RepID=C7QDJ8_CATAD|nr:cell wall-binding repeat-containing protein [Catenulispora acidiphila]ACU74622.1 Periplasmic component of the Tol biopolymer transport system-like protein [Catenulispora acidiphila DSM 44928]